MMVRVSVASQAGSAVETDLDGRFRTGPLAPGTYAVRASFIGYRTALVDSIRVASGATATVTVALEPMPVQLDELTVTSSAPTRISSSAGLLAAQQNAMAVVDGISAETISRTPDSDAGQAVLRVTGLSVVDDKVVVRGLSERYSSSLLNGVEIASPEPDKKFVALDAFSSSLIESIVAAKTATPDRPGDFAGGVVDILTKEFPSDGFVSLGVSQSYNSRSTFKQFARMPRQGSDVLGFNGANRGLPRAMDPTTERFAEVLSNVWTPGLVSAAPQSGLNLALGGRKDLGSDVLGYIVSVDYGSGRSYNPDRYDNEGEAPIRFDIASERVELSGVANLAYRLGQHTKLGFKNFYSRSSEETVRQGVGGDAGDGPSLNYQVNFTQQFVAQSQLTGDHVIAALGSSRLEWKASYGRAERDEPDNRQLRYFDSGDGFFLTTRRPQLRFSNELNDVTYSGQGDWSLPFGLRNPGDVLVKVGASYRRKNRTFDANSLVLEWGPLLSPSYLALPPEQLLAPENLGAGQLSYAPAGLVMLPYTGTDRVTAAYAMLDFEVLPSLRLVGGARFEKWYAQLIEGAGVPTSVERTTSDVLWSANLTYSLSPTTNIRLAAYRTVARPDLRELSSGGYTPIVGGFPVVGNPALQSSDILNGDLRFEVYPAAEELYAVSLFYKEFDRPIVTTLIDAGGTNIRPENGIRATSLGAEFEVRKRLGFLTPLLEPILLSGNVTLLQSRIDMPPALGVFDEKLAFQGQSPYLVNVGVTYAPQESDLSVSLLFNRFGDRILRYPQAGPASQLPGPNVVERGRSTIDGKVKLRIWRALSGSLAGKNLTNSSVEIREDRLRPSATSIALLGRSTAGVSFSLGLSYDF